MAAARYFNVLEVYGDDGVVDGVEDVEKNTLDTFLCSSKAPNGGEGWMERRCCLVARPTSSR
jgi:hypothetical protein